jgi:O-antigen/teichoic acid export membrane protein
MSEAGGPSSSVGQESSAQQQTDLAAGEAGGRVIRGGAMRIISFVGQLVLSLIAVPLMVRHLGADDYGRYVTVTSLVFIVAGFTEGGLMYLGVRHYVGLKGTERERYLRNIGGLRLVLTVVGMSGAVAFTALTGAGHVIVVGTAIAGLGSLLLLVQQTYSVPLQAELRFAALSAVELLRQLVLTAVIVLCVAVGTGLVPFFWASVASGAAVLIATLALVGRGDFGSLVPAFDLSVWRRVAHEILPYGVATAVGLVYYRVGVVLMSYISTPYETGIYSTAFRIVETVTSVPWLAVSAAFPILVHAAANDADRMRYALQRLFETSMLIGVAFALAIALGARFAVDVIAGPGFDDAVPVLRLQGLALITSFLIATWSFALLSLERFRQLLLANLAAVVVVIPATVVFESWLGAQGTALALVLAETVLALGYLFALVRRDRTLQPQLGFLWKIALAAVVGLLAGLLPVPSVVMALIGLALYGAVALLTRAIPLELLNAFLRRAS